MNATLNKISVTSLKIGDHVVPVPVGLSELLADTWTAKRKEKKFMTEYHRQVIRNDDCFVTVLTKRER